MRAAFALVRVVALGAMAMLACCLPMDAWSQSQPASGPRLRLVYQTISDRGDGQWRLRDLPEGLEEWVLWEWTNDPWERKLSTSYCAISGDCRHALFVQEWLVGGYFPTWTLALADLAEPIHGGKAVTIENMFYLVDYPVWLDESRLVLGVADGPDRTERYRRPSSTS